jgi:GntR family transcriptional regulator
MVFRSNPSSGMPLYLQLMEQIKHAIETGALRAGDQLPTLRKMAEDFVMTPNTVARAYRELEHEGVIELKHGSGAFVLVAGRARVTPRAQTIVQSALERLASLRLTQDEIRRLFENELGSLRTRPTSRDKHIRAPHSGPDANRKSLSRQTVRRWPRTEPMASRLANKREENTSADGSNHRQSTAEA